MTDESFRPNWFSHPGETLRAILAERGLSSHVLAAQMQCEPAKVRALLAGVVEIDRDLAERLSNAIGGAIEFWLKRQATYRASLESVARSLRAEGARDWLKTIPWRSIKEYGWIASTTNKDDAIESCLSFFGVTSPDEWKHRYGHFANEFSFRSSGKYESTIGALSAWLRRGEIEAAGVACLQWNSKELVSRLDQLRALSRIKSPAYFVPRLQQMCAEVGVAVVFVRPPSGCRASGAARFISPDKALIILSFRHLSDDHFWFTFFHEVGHLILHGATEKSFVDGQVSAASSLEAEANDFSGGVLIPIDRQDVLRRLTPSTKEIVRFAINVGVSPGIVVGQMQHKGLIGPHQMNFLKRRYGWAQISAALN